MKPIALAFGIFLFATTLVIALQRYGGRDSDSAEPNDETAARTTQERATAAADVYPQPRSSDSVAPRRREPPGFLAMESQFGSEPLDPRWAGTAESRILGRISLVTGLELVALTAECRTTICRVQLSHAAGTRVPPSLATLKAPANEVGLGHATEAITFGDDGAPISVLYFSRKGG